VASGGSSLAGTTWWNAALAAGTLTLETQLVIALANGVVDGDIAGSMEELASSDTLKSIAVSMVTAGALAKIDAAFFQIDSSKVQEAADAARTLAEAGNSTAIQIQQAVADAIKKASSLSLEAQVLQALTHATVDAGVKTIAAGDSLGDFGDTFVDSLLLSAVDRLGEEMATEIGLAAKTNDINTAIKYIAHAATGCVIGIARADISDTGTSSSENCVSGGTGAVVGEFIGESVKSSSEHAEDIKNIEGWLAERGIISEADYASLSVEEQYQLHKMVSTSGITVAEIQGLRKWGVRTAELGAALTAFVAGLDVQIAAEAGKNAAENNAL
ncbi:DUF637 domain-containing protein, partial [Microbulbifer epialgicus]